MADPGLTICHLLHPLHQGGAEVLAARIAHWFAGVHRAVFACLEDVGPLGERLRAEGFSDPEPRQGPGVDWGLDGGLRAFFRVEAVDLVHAHHCGPFLYAAMARFPGRRPPVLLIEHGRPYARTALRPRRMLTNRFLLRRRDRFVAVGALGPRAMIDDEGFPADRIEVVLNGIDLSALRAGAPDRAAVRRELGLGGDEFVLMQVARLNAVKDHETALRALEAVRPRRPDARLVLIGDGPEAAALRARSAPAASIAGLHAGRASRRAPAAASGGRDDPDQPQ